MKHLLFLVLTLVVLGCESKPQKSDEMPNLDDTEFQRFIYSSLDSLEKVPETDFVQPLISTWCKADLVILKHVLKEAQTSLYRFSSYATVDSAFNAAYQSVNDSTTYLDFVGLIARLDHIIACGHSGWGHNTRYFDYRNAHVKLLPVDIYAQTGKYYLFKNNSKDTTLPEDVEIVEVNGRPMPDIINELSLYMVKDGNSNMGLKEGLQGYFSNAYSNFIDRPESYLLKLKDNATGTISEHAVESLLKPEIDSIRKLRHPYQPKFNEPLLYNYIDSLNTGIYTIKWFNKGYMEYFNQSFEGFTDSVFAALSAQNAKNLIIDLRGNVGGWTAYGNYLFSHCIDQPTNYMDRVEVKQYNNFTFDTLITSYPGYLDTFELKQNNEQRYDWINYPSLTANPKPNRFTGQIYILTDALSRSCSGVFSTLMKNNTSAIFVGEETGSSRCGAGGMVMAVILPYTKINIYFSTAEYTTAIKDKRITSGVKPDIMVSGSKALEKTIGVINKQRKP